MEALFEGVNHWHWWSVAAVMVVLEVLSPGFFFLWLGIAAGAVGLLVLLFPALAWEWQVILFGLLAIVSILIWRHYARRHPQGSDQPTLNRRGAQYVGRTFTLNEPIVNGRGKIRVDDTTWKVEGADCPAGRQVKVVGVDGTMLRVEPQG